MQDYSPRQSERYGQRLAAHLSASFFAAQPEARLDGPALLTFTPVRQVNLLVLRQLLTAWQQQAQALRSAYFDYEAAPVQAALMQFQNVLSRHIALDRQALEPLLARAIANTLHLAADPGSARAWLLPADPTAPVALDYLRAQLRYLDQARPVFAGFFESLAAEAGPLDRAQLGPRLADYVSQHRTELPDLAAVVTALDALLPLTVAELQADSLPADQDDAAAEAPAAAASLAPAPEVAPNVPEPPSARPSPAGAAEAPPTEVPAAPTRPSLRELISINQRYSFINELFEGENMAYHAFVQTLDLQPTVAAALALLQQRQTTYPAWQRKEEHVTKLAKLLERKFADD